MNVAFVTSIFPNPAEPTLGMFHGQLAAELRHFCDMTVLSPHPWFPPLPAVSALERWQKFGRIPAEFTVSGVRALSPKYLMVPAVSETIRPSLMYPSLARAAARLHRARPIDVIDGLWLYPDGIAAAKVARRLRVPLVLTALGCDVNLCLEHPAMRSQILEAVAQAHAVIAVSDALKERLCREGVPPDKVTVITNGVDTATFRIRDRRDVARELGVADDGIRRCLFVGRLAEEKGVLTLIAAMGHLHRKRQDVRLYVIGDGPEAAAARELVASLGLREDVVFLGARQHDEIASWIGACELLALPSLREGCPNVVLEALASGRPVVASAVGGVPDLIGATNGVLVPPQQPEAMSEGIDRALGIAWDEHAIRSTVSDRSWRHTAQAYAAVFRSACRTPVDPVPAWNAGVGRTVDAGPQVHG